MFSVGAISATLGINTNEYSRGILNANALNEAFGSSFVNFVTNPIAGGIALLKDLGGAFISRAQGILETAEKYERLAQVTGFNVELLQALSAKFEQAGFSAEAARSGLSNFAKKLGEASLKGGEAAKVFENLGVTLTGNDGVEETFLRTVEAMSKMESRADRLSAAADLFTRFAGAQFLSVLDGGAESVDRVVKEMTSLGQVLGGETNGTIADLNTEIGRLLQLMDGVVNVGVAAFIKELLVSIGLLNTDIVATGDSLISEIIPAAERLGQTTGQLVGDLSSIADTVERIAGVIGPVSDFLELNIKAAGAGGTALAGVVQTVAGLSTNNISQTAAGVHRIGALPRLGREIVFEDVLGPGGVVQRSAARR